jgi:hypothetical protein
MESTIYSAFVCPMGLEPFRRLSTSFSRYLHAIDFKDVAA